MSSYKSKIQAAVGDEGKILTDVMDTLHLVIGEQPHVSDSIGQEAKNRFTYVLINFFKAICTAASPVALIIEDLQWIDSESHDLLSSLLIENCPKNFIFIGTYRQNEVSDLHPVSNLLECMKEHDISTTMIKLDNLEQENVNDLISDTLYLPPMKSYPLAALIHNKTKGNPFFVKQMMASLYEQALIFFCSDKREWKWDDSMLEGNNMTENVLELISRKILSFDEDSQYALKVASCLGSPFSLEMLKIAVDCKGIDCSISEAMFAGYKGSNILYLFAHDNIQQAAYSLIDDTKSFFWKIGVKLWTALSSKELNENIFTVANLLINSLDMIKCQKDCLKMSDLFLRAGKRAMASTAFKNAFTYLNAGIQLLNSESWSKNYDLAFDLYNTAAKGAYCNGNISDMNVFINEVVNNTPNKLHQLDSYLLQIRHFNDKGKHKDAIRVGISFLDKIGVKIDLGQCESVAASEVQNAKKRITETTNLTLADMRNESSLAVMNIFNSLVTSAFSSDKKFLFLIASRMVNLTLKEGVCKYSCMGFCTLGSVLCATGDELSIKFGKLALDLIKRVQTKEIIPRVHNLFYITISPFHESAHASLKPLQEVAEISLEVGLQEEFEHSFAVHCSLSFFCGTNLAHLLEYIQELETFSKLCPILSLHQAILNLISEDVEKAAILCGKKFNFERCFDGSNKNITNSRALVICSVISYLFYDYISALKFVRACRHIKNHLLSTFMYPIYIFYESLVLLACGKDDIKIVEENLMILKSFSSNAPQNYLNKGKIFFSFLKRIIYATTLNRITCSALDRSGNGCDAWQCI